MSAIYARENATNILQKSDRKEIKYDIKSIRTVEILF